MSSWHFLLQFLDKENHAETEARLWKLANKQNICIHLLNPKRNLKFFGKKPSLEYYANRHHSQHRSRSPQTDWSSWDHRPWDRPVMQPWRQKTMPWCRNPWFKRFKHKNKNLSSAFPRPDVVCYNLRFQSTRSGKMLWKFQVSLHELPNTNGLPSPARQSVHCHMSNSENDGKFQAPAASFLRKSTSTVLTFALSLSCPGTLVSFEAGLGAERLAFHAPGAPVMSRV